MEKTNTIAVNLCLTCEPDAETSKRKEVVSIGMKCDVQHKEGVREREAKENGQAWTWVGGQTRLNYPERAESLPV